MSDIEYIEKSGLNMGMSGLLEDKKQELEDIRQETNARSCHMSQNSVA